MTYLLSHKKSTIELTRPHVELESAHAFVDSVRDFCLILLLFSLVMSFSHVSFLSFSEVFHNAV